MMKNQIQRWTYWLATACTAFLSGIILIPLLRTHPESVHDFVLGLAEWQQVSFIFVACVLYAYAMFKLLSPRILHLRHICRHPPTWLAWLIGVLAVAIVDLRFGLQPGGYQATLFDWIGYAGGSTLAVWGFRLATDSSVERLTSGTTETFTLANVATVKWEIIEEWLHSDAPATYDFLGNYAVAKRITEKLQGPNRSVGIVGQFGAGKTSIVEWIKREISLGSEKKTPKLLLSQHSCWGFTNSSKAIHEILESAIAVVESDIDTFHVKSLPDSYRQTFSAGGEWVGSISNLVLAKRAPSEQFARLSDLLNEIDARLVIVVEDVDRNDSQSFDSQELLAFLQQLKEFRCLKFVIAAGQEGSHRIDFLKLCDHIEYLPSIAPSEAFTMVNRVRSRCRDLDIFPFFDLSPPKHRYLWDPQSSLMLRDLELMGLPQAISVLLRTPRALRHALGRTYHSWRKLYGEIDWDHLLAINVLRFAAPECFSFIVQHWDRLKSAPSDRSTFGEKRMERIKQSIRNEWEEIASKAEWNKSAAEVVMDFILPPISAWLGNARPTNPPPPQGVQYERYWIRALNEAIPPDSVKDQTVIRDLINWKDTHDADSSLIRGICGAQPYGNVWEDVAGRFLDDCRDEILLVCEQVLARVLREHGSAASHDHHGFIAVWRFANSRVGKSKENASWLNARIAESACKSLEFVNSLWHYFGSYNHSILAKEDCEAVRKHAIEQLRSKIRTSGDLERIMHVSRPHALYQLVFDPNVDNQGGQVNIADWTWLSPALIESLRNHSVVVAVGVSMLIAMREAGFRNEPWRVDPEILYGLFQNDAPEAVTLLGRIADSVADEEQQRLVRAIAESAKAAVHAKDTDSE